MPITLWRRVPSLIDLRQAGHRDPCVCHAVFTQGRHCHPHHTKSLTLDLPHSFPSFILQLHIYILHIYSHLSLYCFTFVRCVHCVSRKNIPDIFSCNSRKHCRIFIIFGTRVTEKVSNQ